MKVEETMKLGQARAIAEELVEKLRPYCRQIEIAGSIRRQRPTVHDIDIVMDIETGRELPCIRNFLPQIASTIVRNGPKLARFFYHGIGVDLYYATHETWATLLLIRTGSKENNIRLCATAKRRGWKLKANGEGLFNEHGERIAGDSERDLYEALGLPYQSPRERR